MKIPVSDSLLRIKEICGLVDRRGGTKSSRRLAPRHPSLAVLDLSK
jgi:hypothetical protein